MNQDTPKRMFDEYPLEERIRKVKLKMRQLKTIGSFGERTGTHSQSFIDAVERVQSELTLLKEENPEEFL